MIEAKIIADSISADTYDRLTTFELNIHRFILPEANTHRVFSRNSGSSRAIPVEKTLAKLFEDPAFPASYPCEQPGMQGGEELTGIPLLEATNLLNDIADYTLMKISDYIETHPDKEKRVHKSVLNRPLEWFSWHRMIVSSTEWNNFFKLRDHKDAQKEIQIVAALMKVELANSEPQTINSNQWHLPYLLPTEHNLSLEDKLTICVARCARVSYENHRGIKDIFDDQRLFNQLKDSGHWSPFEHVAKPSPYDKPRGNFRGWQQLRHLYETE
jgi:hypothetical protein